MRRALEQLGLRRDPPEAEVVSSQIVSFFVHVRW